ncbi:MAG: hypothetical protein JWR26_3467 [Pedosphaera sp.]|nr:hypothetical protein [Pedosphaera sp.]
MERQKTGPLTGGNGENGVSREKWPVEVRWAGLVRWAPKAQCHLSPDLIPQPKRTGGCLRTATGVDLECLNMVTRLGGAWALGLAGAMDMVDSMDGMDLVEAGGERDLKDEKDQRDLRLCLGQGQREGGQAYAYLYARPLSRRISPNLGVSRSVSLFSDVFFSGVLADGNQEMGWGNQSDRSDRGKGKIALLGSQRQRMGSRNRVPKHCPYAWLVPTCRSTARLVLALDRLGTPWNGLDRVFRGHICFSGVPAGRHPGDLWERSEGVRGVDWRRIGPDRFAQKAVSYRIDPHFFGYLKNNFLSLQTATKVFAHGDHADGSRFAKRRAARDAGVMGECLPQRVGGLNRRWLCD